MKKLIGLFLLAGMFTFTACGGKKQEAAKTDSAAVAAPAPVDTTAAKADTAKHDAAGHDAAGHGEKKAAH
jgi:uncharacterized lipoprotein YajG